MSRSFGFPSAGSLLLVLAIAANASADTILLYKGKTYETAHNDPSIAGEYKKSMRVTGWVALADPLQPNSTYNFLYDGFTDDGLLGFSLFDGVWYHDRLDESGSPWSVGAEFASLQFSTDAKSNIVAWDFFWSNLLAPGVPLGGGDMDMWMSSNRGDGGYLLCDNCDPFISQSFSTSRTGRWSVARGASASTAGAHLVAVPEPSTLSLLSLGAGALALTAYRRRSSRR